jgi:hypothetical protein
MGLAANAKTLGALQFDAGCGWNGLFFLDSSQDSIAAAGTNQATAYQLTRQNNRLTTVSAGTGVVLPPALQGLEVIVCNHGANSCIVYGNGSDTIVDVAGSTGVPLMSNSTAFFMCMTSGKWYVEGLASGFVSGVSTAGALTLRKVFKARSRQRRAGRRQLRFL